MVKRGHTSAAKCWYAFRISTCNAGVRGRNQGGSAGAYTCNPDFNDSQLGVVTRWTPVKNLTFAAEVGAFFLDQKMTGAATLSATAPKPNTVYEFKDQSTVFLNVRAQRNF